MSKNFKYLAYLFAGLLLMVLSPVAAKGNFSKVVISGGMPPTKISIIRPDLTGFFDFSDFPNTQIHTPDSLGDGYVILRGWDDESSQFAVFDMLYYYPGAAAADGVIYYVGLVNGGSEYDGKWYRVSANADKALKEILDIEDLPKDTGG